MKTAKQVISKLKRKTSKRVAQEIGNRIGELLCAKCPTLLTGSDAKLCPECSEKEAMPLIGTSRQAEPTDAPCMQKTCRHGLSRTMRPIHPHRERSRRLG
jgi:hypothetical protein